MKKTCGMHFYARALTKRKHSGVNNEYGVNRIGRQTVFTMEYFWRFNRFLFLSIFLCGGVGWHRYCHAALQAGEGAGISPLPLRIVLSQRGGMAAARCPGSVREAPV